MVRQLGKLFVHIGQCLSAGGIIRQRLELLQQRLK